MHSLPWCFTLNNSHWFVTWVLWFSHDSDSHDYDIHQSRDSNMKFEPQRQDLVKRLECIGKSRKELLKVTFCTLKDISSSCNKNLRNPFPHRERKECNILFHLMFRNNHRAYSLTVTYFLSIIPATNARAFSLSQAWSLHDEDTPESYR